MRFQTALIAAALASITSTTAPAQQGQPRAETVQDMLAAQIRLQGFVCDKPLHAGRDAKRSRPDYEVWRLTCTNATYRVGRAPDMSATVKRLR
jgi:hypothetical protein